MSDDYRYNYDYNRTYASAPLAPQIWGEPELLPPDLGGRGAKRWCLHKSCIIYLINL